MKIKIPLEVVELEEGNYHLFAGCTFENGESGYWALDTGASKTIFNRLLSDFYFIDEESVDSGIQSSGLGDTVFETHLGTLMPFSLGDAKIENLHVALIDLSHINMVYHKATEMKICGLIGGDFFYRYNAIIDYNKKMLILNTNKKNGIFQKV